MSRTQIAGGASKRGDGLMLQWFCFGKPLREKSNVSASWWQYQPDVEVH